MRRVNNCIDVEALAGSGLAVKSNQIKTSRLRRRKCAKHNNWRLKICKSLKNQKLKSLGNEKKFLIGVWKCWRNQLVTADCHLFADGRFSIGSRALGRTIPRICDRFNTQLQLLEVYHFALNQNSLSHSQTRWYFKGEKLAGGDSPIISKICLPTRLPERSLPKSFHSPSLQYDFPKCFFKLFMRCCDVTEPSHAAMLEVY